MTQNNEFELVGLKEVLQKFHDLPYNIQSKITKSALNKMARLLRDAVIRRAPVGPTGRLADSIKVTSRGLKQDTNTASLKVITGPFYSRFVEFGTVKMSAHPFMRPAYDESMQEMSKIFQDALKKGLERALKKR